MARALKPGVFSSEVFGISSYEAAAETLSSGDALRVMREPLNKSDSNAIRLDNPQGQTVGYLPAKIADRYVKRIDEGQQSIAVVVLTLTREKNTRSCNIAVAFAETQEQANKMAWEQSVALGMVRREIKRTRKLGCAILLILFFCLIYFLYTAKP